MDRYTAEAILSINGVDRAILRSNGPTLYVAEMNAINALQREISRQKDGTRIYYCIMLFGGNNVFIRKREAEGILRDGNLEVS